MADPAFFGLPLEFTSYRVRTVLCPKKGTAAIVTVAMWTVTGKSWSSWNVVDCSLMPAGCVFCDASCLSQVEELATSR